MGARKATGLFLLLLTTLCLVPCTRSQDQRFKTFLKQHYDSPRTDARRDYCGFMMQQRGMTKPCKTLNTFIHVSQKQILAVCREGGTFYHGTHQSHTPLAVTTCKLKNLVTGGCKYESHAAFKYISIVCDQAGWPVHFNEGV